MRANENKALRAVLSLRSIKVLVYRLSRWPQVLIRLHCPIALRAMISLRSTMLHLQALFDLQRYRSWRTFLSSSVLIDPHCPVALRAMSPLRGLRLAFLIAAPPPLTLTF